MQCHFNSIALSFWVALFLFIKSRCGLHEKPLQAADPGAEGFAWGALFSQLPCCGDPLGPKTLVFEKDKFSYQKFISDLIGIDTKAHTDNSSFWLHIEILTLFLSQLLYILSTDDAVNEIDHSQV